MTWQPIATAPLDGTPVLVAIKVHSNDVAGSVPWEFIGPIIAWWQGTHWEGCFGDTHDTGCSTCGGWFEYPQVRPSHWMPLPPMPDGRAAG